MKVNDRGPVFFRQVRVGRNGRLFRCLKFRTMVVDAEAKLAELQRTNERTGPLFKMDRDPASPASASSCATPASTSCRSCSTS